MSPARHAVPYGGNRILTPMGGLWRQAVSLVRRGMTWLAQVPVVDPLDRRNAPGLQILLMCAVALGLSSAVSSWTESGRFTLALGVSLAGTVGVCFCFWLVRRGQVRTAVALVFAGLLALIVLSYQVYGLRMHAGFQVAHLLPLLLGGLLLGRAALWWGLVVLFGALLLGASVDISRAAQVGLVRGEVRSTLMLSGLTFIVATVMLDRLISASRRAMRRSEELGLAYRKLASEMAEKERTQAQLLQSQKLDVLGRLAGGIAHDFNNILGVILGYVGIARSTDGYDGAPIGGIENAARRGAMMTRRLLGLGHNRMRQVEEFDACVAVRRAMSLIEPLFRGRVAIELDLPARPMPVRLDRDEFELALLNLATNARDAMPDGGTFRLAVDDAEGMVRIVAADTGCGMTPEVAARIFEPFFTTKPHDRGTGIGMAVVWRLIDDAQGRISVDSTPGQGTRMTLLLPRARMAEEAPRHDLTGVRVLLVDDDPQLRPLLAGALGAAGCLVTSAEDGEQAMRALEGMGAPQVFVSDYRLPDTDGILLLHRLAARWPQAVRILITSHRTDDMPLLDERDTALLSKPFAPEQLLELMGQRLGA